MRVIYAQAEPPLLPGESIRVVVYTEDYWPLWCIERLASGGRRRRHDGRLRKRRNAR